MNKLVSLFHKIQSNPSVVRAEHTAWQAAAGAFVAAMSGTHGDVRGAIVVAVAAGLAAVRTLVFQVPAPVTEAEPRPVLTSESAASVSLNAPIIPVTVVSTPSTSASVNVDPAP